MIDATFDGRSHIYELQFEGEEPVFLALVHFESKLSHKGDVFSHHLKVRITINRLLRALRDLPGASTRSIIAGDFNLAPFEYPMLEIDGLNAVSSRHQAQRKTVLYSGQQRQFFYNPMWRFLADASPSGEIPPPYGTYTYNSALSPASNFEQYWNVYDQLLFSPELLSAFDLSSLQIVTQTKSHILLRSDGVDSRRYSDHLPVSFKLNT